MERDFERDVDRLIVLPTQELDKKGVTGYRVDTAGITHDFPISCLVALAYYPYRDTVTFCWRGGDGLMHYSTYSRRKIDKLITSSEDLSIAQARAVKEAIRIIRSKP